MSLLLPVWKMSLAPHSVSIKFCFIQSEAQSNWNTCLEALETVILTQHEQHPPSRSLPDNGLWRQFFTAHKRRFSMELALKPTVPWLWVVINKRNALTASKLYMSSLSYFTLPSSKLHDKDIHLIVMNNSLIIFQRVKKSHMWEIYLQRKQVYLGILRTEA